MGFQFETFDPALIHSNPGVRTDLFPHPLDQVLLTDFFGGVASVDVSSTAARSFPPVLVDVEEARPSTSEDWGIEGEAQPVAVVREGLAFGLARKERAKQLKRKKEVEGKWAAWDGNKSTRCHEESAREGTLETLGESRWFGFARRWGAWIGLGSIGLGIGGSMVLGQPSL